MADIKYCLGTDAEQIPDKQNYIFEPIRKKYNDFNYSREVIRKFNECMTERKGYVYKEVW
ncbi:hypothetical protein C7N83_04910 [Neisseria iguanae]|uniref:Uncharacterized protein n=2 Tax=Neisseria iguanae TaxID=90242 RepID=A0A2P7U0Y4_9NEIS|nr:hypothetical protein C7N83_04910 [Neisseria iguanae]